ncbi:MAG: hypothetical protein AAF570_08610, partial [Bacteroidota bacterium]
ARFLKMMEKDSQEAGHIIRAMTGFPEWIEKPKDIRSAAVKLYFTLFSEVYTEQRLYANLNGQEDDYLRNTANEFTEIAGYLISVSIESIFQKTVYQRLSNQLAVSNVYTIDRINENTGEFIVEDLKNLLANSFDICADQKGLTMLKTFSEEIEAQGFDGIAKTIQAIDEEVGDRWKSIFDLFKLTKHKEYFETDSLNEVMKLMKGRWASVLMMTESHTRHLIETIEMSAMRPDAYEDDNLSYAVASAAAIRLSRHKKASLPEEVGQEEQETAAEMIERVGIKPEMIMKLVGEIVNASLNFRLAMEALEAFERLAFNLSEVVELPHLRGAEDKRETIEMILRDTMEDIEHAVATGEGNAGPDNLKFKILEQSHKLQSVEQLDEEAYGDFVRCHLASLALRATYLDQNDRAHDVADRLAEDVSESISEKLVHRLRIHTVNELRKFFPDYGETGGFDDEIDYDLDSLEGVLGELFREIRNIVKRRDRYVRN